MSGQIIYTTTLTLPMENREGIRPFRLGSKKCPRSIDDITLNGENFKRKSGTPQQQLKLETRL